MRPHVLLITLGLLLSACGGGETPAPTGTETTEATAPADDGLAKARDAAAIAKAIQANPDGYDEILKEHGMSAAELESLMYTIALDPALSEAYEAAL